MDKKQVKAIADKEVRKHQAGMHKGQKPTKLAKGGVTTEQAANMGRNMARAANQRSS